MISDIEDKTLNDFMASPISRSQVVLGYLITSWLVGIVLCLFTFVIGQTYVIINGGDLVSFITFIKAFLLIVVSVVSFSSISFFCLSYVKSISTVSAINTMVGTLIGFLAGIYLAIGMFGKGLQTFIKWNPAGQIAALFRKVLMEDPLDLAFENAPVETLEWYRKFYGIDLELAGGNQSILSMLVYILSITLIFYGLSIYRVSRMKR